MSNMNSQTLFSFRTPTTNKDYISLYRWVKCNKNDPGDIDTINLKDSMSGILSKIADCPALRMNKGKNQLSSQESIECNALYLQLLENISDVFMKMPNYLVKQLPGFTEALYNDIKDALSKLKWLQNNNNASTNKTPIIINHYNIQTATINADLNATKNLNYSSYLDDVLLAELNITEESHSVTTNANSVNEMIFIDDDFVEVNHAASTSYIDNRSHSSRDPSPDQVSSIYGNGYADNVERQRLTNNASINIRTINTDDDDFSEVNHSASISCVDNRLHTQTAPSSDQINHIHGNRNTENVERHSVMNNANTNIGVINIDDNDFSEVDHSASTSYVGNRLHTQTAPSFDQINHIHGNRNTENVERHSIMNNANTNIGVINIDDNDFSEVDHSASTSYFGNRLHTQTAPSSDQINHIHGNRNTENVERHSVMNNANTNIGVINIDDNDFSEVDHSASTSYVGNKLHTQTAPSSDQINHIHGNRNTENVERHSVMNNANTNIGVINIDDNDFSEVDHSASTSYVGNRLHTQTAPSSDQINHIHGNRNTENVERHSVMNNANTNIGTINTNDNDFSEVDQSVSRLFVDNRLHSEMVPSPDYINHIYSNGYSENAERHSVTNNANTNIGIIITDDDDFSEVDHSASTSYVNTDDNDFPKVDHSASTSYVDNRLHSRIDLFSDQINHSSDSGRTRNVEPDTVYERTIDNSAYLHDHIYLNSMLRNKFRLQNFREKQIEAINAARFGHNCFIVMPAGAGKSLCYQMPAILSAGVTIVVSPLTSLIRGEIQQLRSLKIKVAHLAGKLGKKAETLIYNELSKDDPDIKLLYVTPEKLMKNNELNELLVSLNNKDLLTRFVIDEAQCVLQWGVSYRMAYSILQELRAKFDLVPITALTSCATERTIGDIQQQLSMSNSKIFRTSLNRPKISYNVSKKDEINDFDDYVAKMIIEKYPRQSGILYCLTRKKCEEMAKFLEDNGVTATAYHSNLSEKTRKTAVSDWILNNCYVICATTSYCMGIDKPDVRFIVYYSLPPSIEGYYKGTGCAGRDGKDAECHLFYSQNDIKTHINICNSHNSDPDLEKIKENRQRQLMEMYEFCTNEHKCRRLALLEYFKDKYNNYDCGIQHGCDVCRNNMETINFDDEYPLNL